MKKSILDTYLEQMQINTGVSPTTRQGTMGMVRHATSSTAGGNVTNKKMAMQICYERYCENLMSEVERKDPVKLILYNKMVAKCKNQCYLNYLHQKKKEMEEKMPMFTGVLLANKQQELKLIDWEISRISSTISKMGF